MPEPDENPNGGPVSKAIDRLKSGWALIALIVAGIAGLAGGLDRAFLAHPVLCIGAFWLLSAAVLFEALSWRDSAKDVRDFLVGTAALLVISAFAMFATAYVMTGDGDDSPVITAAIDNQKRQATISIKAQYFSPEEPVEISVAVYPPAPDYPGPPPPTQGSMPFTLLPVGNPGVGLLRATIGADAKGTLSWSQVVDLPADAQRLFVTASETPGVSPDCRSGNSSKACLYVAIPFDASCVVAEDAQPPTQCVLTRGFREGRPAAAP